jgi:CRISPR/Cas system-associated exonuclease Cas4 (RecB family)
MKTYNPKSKEPFKLSRSKISDFVSCPRCFYLDRRLGISSPGIPAFTLNSAVDALLKKEFDHYRKIQKPHPIMKKYKIDAVPYDHPDIDKWRNNFQGIRYLDKDINLLFYGAVDDVWIDKSGKLLIVDYKSTSTQAEISLEDEWKQWFKIQMDIYIWLFKKNNFNVSSTGYFVYANADKKKPRFDRKLEFDLSIITYRAKTNWIDETVKDMKKCLDSEKLPKSADDCEYCVYRRSSSKVEHTL